MMAVLVVFLTAVMVVMDQVDPRLDCCARRSSHCRSQSHESERGLVVGSAVVVATGEEVIVGCSCRVVMGTKNGCMGACFWHRCHPASFMGGPCMHRNELLHEPSHLQNASWELAFTDCNEQSTLPALPPVNGKEAISYNEDKRKQEYGSDTLGSKKEKRLPL